MLDYWLHIEGQGYKRRNQLSTTVSPPIHALDELVEKGYLNAEGTIFTHDYTSDHLSHAIAAYDPATQSVVVNEPPERSIRCELMLRALAEKYGIRYDVVDPVYRNLDISSFGDSTRSYLRHMAIPERLVLYTD